MSSITPVSEMDVFLGRISHLSKTKNLIGPEFEGQKKISVFGVVPISWLIFIGICCSFFNKDAARTVTFFDITSFYFFAALRASSFAANFTLSFFGSSEEFCCLSANDLGFDS